ncbi:zinc finger, CCHC-type containing protein, partial [Tanacetum coccineum]
IVLAIAALRNLEVHQMDVKTEFLNEDLEEEIYMNQPEGFIAPGQESKVCTRPDLAYAVSRLSRYTSNPSDAHWKAMTKKSSKQTVIAKSTMESEFIALDKCREDTEWLRQFVEDIPRWPKLVTTISIQCDSQSTIGRSHSIMYNGKSRHIRRQHNSIRQLLSTRVISIDYVKSKDNIADPLMKDLSRELVSKSSKGMGLKPLKE